MCKVIEIVVFSIFVITLVYSEKIKLLDSKAADCDWAGIKGKCVSPHTCLTTLSNRQDKHPNCSSEKGQESFVCCTDCELVNDTSNVVVSPTGGLFWKDGRKARDLCLQYLKDLPHECRLDGFYGGISRTWDNQEHCHTYDLWAVGGDPGPGRAKVLPNPYEALMGFGKDLESAVWMTSGAIISNKFILTSRSGHLTTEGKLPLKFAAVGVKNRKDPKDKWQIHNVKKIHPHPGFEDDTRYHNLALLELETAITFNKNVLPACLPDPSEVINDTVATVASWKSLDTNFGTFLDTPDIVEVQELSAKECHTKIVAQENRLAIFYHKFLPKSIDENTQMCYGNKDTCVHTIGSPAIIKSHVSRCMNTVVGVNGYGDVCGVVVFTRVQHYVPWILSVVRP